MERNSARRRELVERPLPYAEVLEGGVAVEPAGRLSRRHRVRHVASQPTGQRLDDGVTQRAHILGLQRCEKLFAQVAQVSLRGAEPASPNLREKTPEPARTIALPRSRSRGGHLHLVRDAHSSISTATPRLRGSCAFALASWVPGGSGLPAQRVADIADFAKQSVRVLGDVDEAPPSVEGGGLLVDGVNDHEPCGGRVAGRDGEA